MLTFLKTRPPFQVITKGGPKKRVFRLRGKVKSKRDRDKTVLKVKIENLFPTFLFPGLGFPPSILPVSTTFTLGVYYSRTLLDIHFPHVFKRVRKKGGGVRNHLFSPGNSLKSVCGEEKYFLIRLSLFSLKKKKSWKNLLFSRKKVFTSFTGQQKSKIKIFD